MPNRLQLRYPHGKASQAEPQAAASQAREDMREAARTGAQAAGGGAETFAEDAGRAIYEATPPYQEGRARRME